MKTLIERFNIKDKVNLIPDKEPIIIRPSSTPRKGWEKAFKEMSENNDDRILFNDMFED